VGISVVALLGVGLIHPGGAGAADGPDVWTPSTWTGEAAGPPVPGTGLPAAAVPTIAAALPQGVYDVSPTYEGQAQCDPTPKPGTQALADLIKATYGQDQTVWIPRACSIGGQSEHKEGRALDWMTSARNAQQRANAETFLAWLLGPDQFGVPYGNAMRLGVMYIGWNDRIWRGYDIKRGWTELKGCFATPTEGMDTTCHRNHIHISFTWDGASGRSSFWDGTPMDGPYCAPAHSSASVPAGGRAADVVPVEAVRVLGTRKAVGVAERCRLQQDRWNGDSHRLYVKVTGQGGVPETGVAAVAVQVVAMASNANSSVKIWAPGQSKSQTVANVPMNKDASGTAVVPVASDGTIVLATSAGATDVAVDVIGYYPPGDVANDTAATPGPATDMGDEPPPAIPPAPAPAAPASAAPAPAPVPTTIRPDAPNDEFTAIGADVGYESTAQGPLKAGEARVVGLNGLPGEATSALVLVTTRDSNKRAWLRMGPAGTKGKGSGATFQFPKKRVRSAVMVVPVAGGQLQLVATNKASVQVRVELLGYAVNQYPIKIRAVNPVRVAHGKLKRGEARPVQVTGVSSLPKKAKWISGVVLQVQTRTKTKKNGSLKAYPSDGSPPGTRSAPILSRQWHTSLLVSKVGADGRVLISPSIKSQARVSIVGFIHR
jgi:hypothetical protein